MPSRSAHRICLTASAAALLAGAGLASAQTPPGAAGRALGAAAQAKVAAPPAPEAVKAGTGGAAAAPTPSEALSQAIAAGDIRRALELGATPKDIVTMLRAADPSMTLDPDRSLFVRSPDGQFAVAGFNMAPATNRSMHVSSAFNGYAPPGGLASLPPVFEAFGPPSPAAPAEQAVGRMMLSGAAPREVATAWLAAQPQPEGAPPLDVAGARFVRAPDGGVALVMARTDGGGFSASRLPGTENFSGLATLPTLAELMATLQAAAPPP